MRRTLIPSILMAFGLAAALTGCSAGPLIEQLPQSMGGLPPDAPQPPQKHYEYPAVHDMPPPRATEPLSEEQQWKLEQDLKALRNRQEGQNADETKPDPGAKTPAKGAKKTAKKKPAPAKSSESTGAKTNP